MSSFRALRVLHVVPAVLALSCSGQIGDPDGVAGKANPTGGSGSGTMTGGNPPTTTGGGTGTGGSGGGGNVGPLVSQPGVTSRFVRLNHQQWENSVRDVLKLPAVLGLSATF